MPGIRVQVCGELIVRDTIGRIRRIREVFELISTPPLFFSAGTHGHRLGGDVIGEVPVARIGWVECFWFESIPVAASTIRRVIADRGEGTDRRWGRRNGKWSCRLLLPVP